MKGYYRTKQKAIRKVTEEKVIGLKTQMAIFTGAIAQKDYREASEYAKRVDLIENLVDILSLCDSVEQLGRLAERERLTELAEVM